VVADGVSTVVCFDYAAQLPIPVSAEIQTAIRELEGEAFATAHKAQSPLSPPH
jgi:hypothetical protein